MIDQELRAEAIRQAGTAYRLSKMLEDAAHPDRPGLRHVQEWIADRHDMTLRRAATIADVLGLHLVRRRRK